MGDRKSLNKGLLIRIWLFPDTIYQYACLMWTRQGNTRVDDRWNLSIDSQFKNPLLTFTMLSIKKNKSQQYIYLVPVEEGLVKWEIIDDDELETRAEENALVEGARLFKIEKEVPIRFERITHLDF